MKAYLLTKGQIEAMKSQFEKMKDPLNEEYKNGALAVISMIENFAQEMDI